jgi:hypothetical protein
MKCRTGFVSNSSSSSFIIGYGVIKNKDKLKKYLKDNKIETTEFYSGDDILEYTETKIVNSYNLMCEPQFRLLSCSNYTEIVIPKELEYGNNEIFIVTINNNEGDSEFWNYAYGDYDYGKAEDISFYSGYQRDLISLFTMSDIIDQKYMQFKIGAERNG